MRKELILHILGSKFGQFIKKHNFYTICSQNFDILRTLANFLSNFTFGRCNSWRLLAKNRLTEFDFFLRFLVQRYDMKKRNGICNSKAGFMLSFQFLAIILKMRAIPHLGNMCNICPFITSNCLTNWPLVLHLTYFGHKLAKFGFFNL